MEMFEMHDDDGNLMNFWGMKENFGLLSWCNEKNLGENQEMSNFILKCFES